MKIKVIPAEKGLFGRFFETPKGDNPTLSSMEVLGPGVLMEPPQLTALSIICVPKRVGKPNQVTTTAFANVNNVMR